MKNIRAMSALFIGLFLYTLPFAHSAGSIPAITHITPTAGQLELGWIDGFAPFQLQSRTSLVAGVWTDLGASTISHSATESLPAETKVFFRILGSASATASAEYRVTFNSTWSAATHPTNFPASEHYSPLIGGTHNQNVIFWQPGALASSGIETMAETGNPSPLSAEVSSAITAGNAQYILNGGGLGNSPGSIQMSFDISQDYPRVSLVTMIAPSPDWFVGVHDLNLFANGDWAELVTVSLLPYDAGTDDGTSYESANADSSPQQPIQTITGFPLLFEGAVAPFGTFEFVRIDTP
ncbi:MAG: spondin domain-containing protein [Pontiella sp.]